MTDSMTPLGVAPGLHRRIWTRVAVSAAEKRTCKPIESSAHKDSNGDGRMDAAGAHAVGGDHGQPWQDPPGAFIHTGMVRVARLVWSSRFPSTLGRASL